MQVTLLRASLGGALIGAAASGLLLVNGRIAGISNIVAGLMPWRDEVGWRWAFVSGLLSGGVALSILDPGVFTASPRSLPVMAVGGFLVGFGARLGNGCTSGHGICGLSRFSKRSLVATLTFMATAGATVFVVHHLTRGAP